MNTKNQVEVKQQKAQEESFHTNTKQGIGSIIDIRIVKKNEKQKENVRFLREIKTTYGNRNQDRILEGRDRGRWGMDWSPAKRNSDSRCF